MGKLCVEGRTEEMRKFSLWGFRGESMERFVGGVLYSFDNKDNKAGSLSIRGGDRVGGGEWRDILFAVFANITTETLAPAATVSVLRWTVQALRFTAS